MKNISLSVSPYLSAFSPPVPPAMNAAVTKECYSISIGAQFDDMKEAIEFAQHIMVHIQTFNET